MIDLQRESAHTERLVNSLLNAWRTRDIATFMSMIAPGVIWSINIDGSLAAVAETINGAAAVRQKVEAFHNFFDFHAYDVQSLKADGTVANVRVFVRYSHRRSGAILETQFRMAIERTGDAVTMIAEYHDKHYLEAFLRLVGRE